jgi:hypothetical protein
MDGCCGISDSVTEDSVGESGETTLESENGSMLTMVGGAKA